MQSEFIKNLCMMNNTHNNLREEFVTMAGNVEFSISKLLNIRPMSDTGIVKDYNLTFDTVVNESIISNWMNEHGGIDYFKDFHFYASIICDGPHKGECVITALEGGFAIFTFTNKLDHVIGMILCDNAVKVA